MTSITLAEILTLCFSLVATIAIVAYVVLTHTLHEEGSCVRFASDYTYISQGGCPCELCQVSAEGNSAGRLDGRTFRIVISLAAGIK